MQWVKKDHTKKYPKDGTTRTIKRFLFFPKEINGIVKWLEVAKIHQIYYSTEIKYHETGGLFGGPTYTGGDRWFDKRWEE